MSAVVIVGIGANSNDGAIRRKGNAVAAPITSGFSIDIATELIPGGGS